MTKAELVEDVARAAELTKKDAERLVEIVFESIIETLNHGEKIELRGFGSFRVRERGARRGRNPKTGDPVDIPAKRVPYFKPGKELKELINEAPDADASSSDASPANGPGAATQTEGGEGGQTPPLM
jgi:integration host factor subunit beta